jgi:hypothetical protein
VQEHPEWLASACASAFLLTPGEERRRFDLKTPTSPINPDFDDGTGNLKNVRRRDALLTFVFKNHLFSFEPKRPQYGPFESIPSF